MLLLATLANTIISQRATHKLISSTERVEHTRIILDELDGISLSLVTAETAERGYIYTGDRKFIAPYTTARSEIGTHIDRLVTLTQDNPVQQQRIPLLRYLVERRVELLNKVIAYEDAGQSREARQEVVSGGGMRAMQAVKQVVEATRNEELRLLRIRSADSQNSARYLLLAVPLANAFTALLIVLVGLLLARELRKRTHIADRLRELVRREQNARTEAETAKQALIQSEKLAAVGRLAATIAHEINNPLEAVTNLIYLTNMDASLDESARRNLSLADAELKRVALIAKQTLGFYRDSSTPKPVNLKIVFDDVLGLYASRIKNKDITVQRDYVHGNAYGLSGELRQMFCNLLLNAIDAVDSGGSITVRTLHHPNSPDVRVTVADNGSGIPPQHLNDIFKPFFTTKTYTGTGLGLWVSKQIVEKHGGRIRVRSTIRPDRHYTIFCISLPSKPRHIAAAG